MLEKQLFRPSLEGEGGKKEIKQNRQETMKVKGKDDRGKRKEEERKDRGGERKKGKWKDKNRNARTKLCEE